jgi:hypothetical protein
MTKFLILPFLLLCQFSYAQVFDIDTLWFSGQTNSRINLVIMGDGYQSSEFSQFVSDANNFTNALFLETPYKEYKNFFNVFAIKVPSNESGASHPGTATDVSEPAHPISIVDNYFGSTFDYFNIHRLLVATNTTAITNVLANNFPSYDQAFILVNTSYYGGSGGQYPTASLSSSSSEIAIHELGHSFVNLKDEYYAGDVYASEGINMTQETNPNNVKWANWMNQNGIGIYQHCCGGNSASWYRPNQSCKMRMLGNPLCSVCVEGSIEKIHALVSPIDSYSPSNTGLINITNPITFKVTLIEPIPNTLKINWILNGNALAINIDSVILNTGVLLSSSNQLQVTIQDTTSLLRIDNHETIHFYTILWDINVGTASIENISRNALDIKLFPNPMKDVLSIQLAEELTESYGIEITDLSGRLLITEKVTSNKMPTQLDVSNLPQGVYIINFKFKNNIIVSRKVIKS